MKIAVIGGGIIGASIGYHLAREGAAVTLLQGPNPGGEATPASFAWINASQENSHEYFKLRLRSIELWSDLGKLVEGLEPNFSGSVAWELPAEQQTAYIEQMSACGYQVQQIGRDAICKREPNLQHVPECAVLCTQDGAIEPIVATTRLIQAMQAMGGVVLRQTCTGIETVGGRVRAIITPAQKLPVDAVVFATGADTTVLGELDYSPPISAPSGLLIYTSPVKPILGGLVLSDKVHMRQTRTGAIVAGSDYGGAKVGKYADVTANEVFDTVIEQLPDAGLELASFIVGYRPTPRDGYPLVGLIPDHTNAYVAIMHSGVTLAPAIGLMAAREIMLDERDPLLDPYTPNRYR